ncbi:phosphosulfolactate synthase [Jatrophihabitans sp. GAS493]|nr:phosphosulfolactate synthase [Jatrophihabitans sp. GAS493]
MVMDGGLPTRYFIDVVSSFGGLIDVMKLGWGTSLVTDDLKYKIDALADAGVDFYFGGTLFEKFLSQDRFDDWRRFCDRFDCRYVEVSNGTIPLSNQRKAQYVDLLANDYRVFSEVGFKDQAKSEAMTAQVWIDYIRQDLAAGAHMVITESRESGKSGICSADGRLKRDLIDQIAESDINLDRVLFEAPTKDVQIQLIRRFGSQVNLGNISTSDIVALETLRLGLRGDTLLDFATVSRPDYDAAGEAVGREVQHA